MSGNQSSSPHTTLAATFLSSVPLKVVGERCINEVIEMVEKKNCKCMNIAVDGESLHLATSLPNGSPGTVLSLVKSVMKKLQLFSKECLVKLISQNSQINTNTEDLLLDVDEVDDFQEQVAEVDLVSNLEDSLALVQVQHDPIIGFSLEDIEEMLGCSSGDSRRDKSIEMEVKQFKIAKLRLICLKHILPIVKKKWLLNNIGQEKIPIFFQEGDKYEYSPSNVFHKSREGFYRTITFDYAHLMNLYRESASRGKLSNMGLSSESLLKLCKNDGFEFLEKIISVQNGKLKFDSMNQRAAELLFSERTVAGLKVLEDFAGAKCVDVISKGVKALDESGRSSENRVKSLINLKNFLVEKNDIFERLKRPDKKNITNELYTMTLTSIDSHLFTYLNLEFFNPRYGCIFCTRTRT